MAVFNEPSKWQTSLVNSGDANTIPQSTPAGTGEASFEDGFPQITQVPIGAGGIAPDRKDFNGLFKVLGDWIFFSQNGGLPTYSSDFDYVVGRYVVYNNTLYKCIQANGASSTVVAPDSVDPDYLGSDYWVQVATLADFANLANIDFSNVTAPTQAFKDMSVGWGAVDTSAPVSISSGYIAPSDGYAVANVSAIGAIGIAINGVTMTALDGRGTTIDGTLSCRVGKGDTVTLINFGGSASNFRFFPCKGAN